MRTLHLSLLLFFCFQLSAQDKNDNIFQTFGYYLGGANMPAFEAGPTNTAVQYRCYNMGINYQFRYNLFNTNDHNSLSLSAIPGIGIDGGEYRADNLDLTFGGISGWLGLHLPVMLSYNTGAGATYDTDKNYGLGISLGLEYMMQPLFIVSDGNDVSDFKQSYTNPFVQIGVRYWGKKTNLLREFFVQIKLLKNKDGIEGDAIVRPYSVNVGWIKFLNY